jgi:predicted lipid-binding transport protein (Tim44 family)
MKRSLALISLVVLVLTGVLMIADAWARAGRGGSSGSRGSRSYSAPMSPSSPTPTPARPSSPSGFDQGSRSGMSRGLMGGIAGFMLGGLLGSLLFGGMGGGFGGGIGLMDILIVGALVMFGLAWWRRRQQTPVPAGGSAYTSPPQDRNPSYPTGWSSQGGGQAQTATAELAGPGDLDQGIGHIRQMDSAFDPARVAEVASDAFFKVQAAWTQRDMGAVRELLTPDMYASLQQQCDGLRAERRVNRLENIAVRTASVTEAWQESGQDFVTVHFLASVLDYTTDEAGRQVLEGNRTEPVKFEEFWTFARPVGPNPWKLSAIQQAV